MFDDYPNLKASSTFTQDKLQTVRRQLQESLAESRYGDKITLVATGSYGRGEATPESDMDWYMILDADQVPEEVIPDELRAIQEIIAAAAPNSAGDTGTFGPEAWLRFSDMLANIGGHNDDNKNLTRRMLFLLEGNWLYGDQRFSQYRRKLLEKYFKEDSPEGQIPHFLLNDVIRYYRTIATDFEYKVTQAGKSWGLRKTKLRFSRKLLYFGGLITIAEVTPLTYTNKLEKADELFDIPVLKRVNHLSEGQAIANDLLDIYEQFSTQLTDPRVRHELGVLKREDRETSSCYQALKALSEQFSQALASWLQAKYPAKHPIHHAMLF